MKKTRHRTVPCPNIPSGTGMKCYSDVEVKSTVVPEDTFNAIEIPME